MPKQITEDPQLPITLYTWVMSPYAMKVHSFLLYKRLNFQCYYVNPLKRRAQIPVGKQLPVLRIGSEVRADSTPIGIWLDEEFPLQPRLLPEDTSLRQRLLAANDWVSTRLIPLVFRMPQEPGFNLSRIINGWKLSRVMATTAHGGLPALVRWAWPAILAAQPFLQRELAAADPGLPTKALQQQLLQEFTEQLEGGPFFAGQATPSMADVAAYPQFLLPYQVALANSDYFLSDPKVLDWLHAMSQHISGYPLLLPEVAQVRRLPWEQPRHLSATQAA